MRTDTAQDAAVAHGAPPRLESEGALRADLVRLGGRLAGAGWALGLLGALVATASPPAGDLALVVVAAGLAGGTLTASLPASRRARMSTAAVALALVGHVVAIAVALDATGVAAAGASVLAAAYAGATVPGLAGRLLVAGAAFAPVLVAAVATGRPAGVLGTAVALAPVALAVGLSAAALRERAARRESVLLALARRDPLTGVRNYRGLHDRLAETVAHDPRRFALLTMDVDEFKAVNDRYGHLEGDRLLREVSRALVDNVRGKDVVARQGGDEFAVLAPETGEEGAKLLAERITKAIGEIALIEDLALSASIGIAVYPDDGRTPEELLARSDDALRELKVRRRVDAVPA